MLIVQKIYSYNITSLHNCVLKLWNGIKKGVMVKFSGK